MDEIETLAEQLEPTIDRHGIAGVLEALAVLAALKAEHVETNWGERGLARSWAQTAKKIELAAGFARRQRL